MSNDEAGEAAGTPTLETQEESGVMGEWSGNGWASGKVRGGFSICAGLCGFILLVALGAPPRVRAETPAHEGPGPTVPTEPSHEGHAGTAAPSSPPDGPGAGSEKVVNTYSLFMHHAAGVGVIIVSLLLLVHRLTGQRFAVLRIAGGATWFLLGLFLFIRSDREGWPIGPTGFLESFTMPTREEWIQHKLLTMIPMFLGIYVGKAHSHVPKAFWTYAAVALAGAGGLALTVHQHLEHPGSDDIVNLQHRLFAITALFIAGSLILDAKQHVTWKFKPYLLPAGLLIMGLQLAFYVE